MSIADSESESKANLQPQRRLMGSPALNEDVVIGKWLLTLSLQVLASNSIFCLVLHYIVIEVILQKKTY